jgi:2,3-diphosphopglycerate-independent phosphoglycerate mutase
MKYIIILGDGMADLPVPELGGKTPLQVAVKPNIDYMAKNGMLGLVKTVPDGISPGSDTANLSVMGFDPEKLYTGRSPIEAVSMGVRLGENDVAFRCNLVSLSDAAAYEDKVMVDYSSDEITSSEAAELIAAVNGYLAENYGRLAAKRERGGTAALGGDGSAAASESVGAAAATEGGSAEGDDGDEADARGSVQCAASAKGGSSAASEGGSSAANAGGGHMSAADVRFYPGISYRHCMVWNGRGLGIKCVPPHDILEKRVGGYLPSSETDSDAAGFINRVMRDSYEYLSAHPVNLNRVRRGLRPANSVWLWGQGKRLALPSYKEKYGLSGAVISAVDLIKGIGISAGLKSIDVEGATGVIDTNYEGKAMAAVNALKDGMDFVYVHVEAPDECGHRHEIENKVKSIEYIDSRLVAVVLKEMDCFGDDYSVMVLPDHPTPLSLRTHTNAPVPFAIYTKGSHMANPNCAGYDEAEAAKTGLYVAVGHTLMDMFLRRKQ